ncbi:hypothetical protein O181_023916 [Austropuccinia psidii MF-1]|uniref:Uncharacterized protein n=1 Tax=Austropuccinia psidii MF-1 TaxID=1389203 RepID=A0A9Q3CFN2_9BASI|nr:hypothetical protein [Austropuccinia psidii MF-1]
MPSPPRSSKEWPIQTNPIPNLQQLQLVLTNGPIQAVSLSCWTQQLVKIPHNLLKHLREAPYPINFHQATLLGEILQELLMILFSL